MTSQSTAVPTVTPAAKTILARGRWRKRTLIVFALVLMIGGGVWGLPWFLKWQARRDLSSRQLDRAAANLKFLERWCGPDGESQFLQARLERKRGNWTAVREALLKAKDRGYPVNLLEREQWLTLAQNGQLRAAEPNLPKLLVDPRDDGAEICEAFVNGYFLNHRMNDALRLLDAWIADYPKDPEPLIIRGKIRVEQQYLKDAETDLRAAWSIDPKSSSSALELADVLVLERQVEAALKIYQQASAGLGQRVRAQLGEAKSQRLLGHPDKARSIAQDILRQEAANREALLEQALADLELNHNDDAVVALTEAVKMNPRSIVARQALARALRATGKPEEAREHAEYVAEAQEAVQKADQLATRITQHPEETETRYQIGMTYLRYAVPERGLQWLKSVLNYDPNHKAAKQALDEYYAAHPESDSSK